MVLIAGRGRVVVTGAGGFIGRAVCEHLDTCGWTVRGLVRALNMATAVGADRLPIGDLETVPEATLANVMREADAVVHLAARVHRMDASNASVREAYRSSNAKSTQRIARTAAAAGVRHFVFASTVKVNGEMTWPGRPFRENDPPAPQDAYAASKWEAEQALSAIAEETPMRVTVLRLPLVYGPGAKANFAQLVDAVRGRRMLPLGGLANRRSLLGIGNLASAITAVLADGTANGAAGSTPYFVADAAAVSTTQLVHAIGIAIGVAPRLLKVPHALLQLAGTCTGRSAVIARLTGSLEVDSAAFCARFHWQPPQSLAEGLAGLHGGGVDLDAT